MPGHNAVGEQQIFFELPLVFRLAEKAPFRFAVEQVARCEQLVGKGEDTLHVVQPVDFAPEHFVQLGAGLHVLVAGEHHLGFVTDLVVDGQVALVVVLPLNPRPAQDHTARIVVRLRPRNIRMGHDEVAHHPVFQHGERVAIGPMLHVFRLPAPGPIAVRVVVAVAVLVHFAVTVVVDALGVEQRVLSLLVGLAGDHQFRKVGVLLPTPVGIADAHLRDVAVAVQIVGLVLVDQAVAIVVDRPLAAARRMRAVRLIHVRVARVGTHHRHEVKCPLVEQPRDQLVMAVRLGQEPGRIECDFGPLDFVGVDAAVDPKRRLCSRRSPFGIADCEHPHLAFAVRLAEAFQPAQIGKRLDEPLKQFRRLREIVIAIPLRRHARVRRRAGRFINRRLLGRGAKSRDKGTASEYRHEGNEGDRGMKAGDTGDKKRQFLPHLSVSPRLRVKMTGNMGDVS